MNVISHHFPLEVGTLDGPQMSLWIKEKGVDDVYGLGGKKVRVCLAS